MDRKSLTSLIAISMTMILIFSAGCTFQRGQKDPIDELIEAGKEASADQEADSSGEETTGEDQGAPAYVPQVPADFRELFGNPQLGSLDWGFNSLYPAASNDDRAKVAFTIDPPGKLIYSIEGQEPGLQLPQVDQAGWGYMMLTNYGTYSGPPPDVVFPCDEGLQTIQDWITVCPEGAGVSGGTDWHVIFTTFEAPIPLADMDHNYTYAAVFDADGEPGNNFQYMEPYNWDYWQGSDQWYILDWIYLDQTWSVSVQGPNWAPVPSNARAVIYDNAVFWIIPAEEFSVMNPGVRVSSFASTGGWDAANVGGDVNGADPTQPLTPLESDPIQVVDPPYTLVSVVLDKQWEICGSGRCKYNETIAEQQKTVVWCTDAGCSALGGDCSLFSRASADSPQDPESWSYVAGSNEKIQKDWSLVYHCFCVK